MNKRIEKLLEKARVRDYWSVDESRYMVDFVNQEKFAQLLIEECSSLTLDFKNQKHYEGWTEYASLIRDHFKDTQ